MYLFFWIQICFNVNFIAASNSESAAFIWSRRSVAVRPSVWQNPDPMRRNQEKKNGVQEGWSYLMQGGEAVFVAEVRAHVVPQQVAHWWEEKTEKGTVKHTGRGGGAWGGGEEIQVARLLQ